MVFPRQSNYSTSLLYKADDGLYMLSHKAAGATKFRYSMDFQSSYSTWLDYTGEDTATANKNWTGTSAQAWKGEHVYVQYFSSLAGSSDHFQHGDLDKRWCATPLASHAYSRSLQPVLLRYRSARRYEAVPQWDLVLRFCKSMERESTFAWSF